MLRERKKRDEEAGRQMVKNLVVSDMVSGAGAKPGGENFGAALQAGTNDLGSVETLWDVRSLHVQRDEVTSYLQHTLSRH